MKQEEKTELTRQRILAAAKVEFGAHGYAGASLNSICAEGIPKGLLYHNFKNKNALYLACVKECFFALTECLKAAEIGTDLQKYMAVRLRFFEKHRDEAHLFFDALLQPPEALREQIEVLRAEFDAFHAALYKRVLASLSLRSGVCEQDALAYFAMVQSMFNGYFSSPAFQTFSLAQKMETHEKNLSRLFDWMLYGIAEKKEQV